MMEIVERSSGYWIVWSNESGVVDHPIFDQQPYVELDEAVAALETYEAEVKWTTKRFWSATKVKPKSMQTPPLNLAYKTTFITNFFIVMNEIVERSSGYWIVDDCGVVDGPFISYSEALENLED